jgi:hypothetical protein
MHGAATPRAATFSTSNVQQSVIPSGCFWLGKRPKNNVHLNKSIIGDYTWCAACIASPATRQ